MTPYVSALIGSVLSALALPVYSIGPSERSALLDTVRPKAAALAAQPVRIKVDHLNVDRGWAVLVGELVGVGENKIVWSKAEACDPKLDKMLWVVLHKTKARWVVKEIDICASEPPYWNLKHNGGFALPCGLYADLRADGGETLDKTCRRQRRGP